jgi:hypothetical protein
MKKLNLTFINNESHGYLKVSTYDLLRWNIKPGEFSKYSYYNKDNACLYIEEDCDIAKFVYLIEAQGFTIRNSEGCLDLKTEHKKHDYFDSNNFVRNIGINNW